MEEVEINNKDYLYKIVGWIRGVNIMKLKVLILTLLILTGWVSVAFADAGYDAYKNKNYSEAMRIWKSEAEDGDAISQYNVGLIYANGHGTLKDDKKAIHWLVKSFWRHTT